MTNPWTIPLVESSDVDYSTGEITIPGVFNLNVGDLVSIKNGRADAAGVSNAEARVVSVDKTNSSVYVYKVAGLNSLAPLTPALDASPSWDNPNHWHHKTKLRRIVAFESVE